MPRPLIGVVAFAVFLFVILAKGEVARRVSRLLGLVFILEGVHLLAIQAYVLHAFCPFCVVIDLASIAAGALLLAERPSERPWLFPRALPLAGLGAFALPLVLALTQPPVVSGQPVAALPKQEGKTVLREYVDLECPYCRMTHVALKKVLEARPDVVIERRHVPLSIHEHAEVAAVAACCASEQSKEDSFVDAVMSSDVEPTAEYCRSVAAKIGLDLARFDECCKSERPKKRIDDDKALAVSSKVPGLPTIEFDGERHVGALDEKGAAAFLARHH